MTRVRAPCRTATVPLRNCAVPGHSRRKPCIKPELASQPEWPWSRDFTHSQRSISACSAGICPHLGSPTKQEYIEQQAHAEPERRQLPLSGKNERKLIDNPAAMVVPQCPFQGPPSCSAISRHGHCSQWLQQVSIRHLYLYLYLYLSIYIYIYIYIYNSLKPRPPSELTELQPWEGRNLPRKLNARRRFSATQLA